MNFKKILATLLAVVMVLGTVSVSFAEDNAIFEIEEVEEIVELFEVEEASEENLANIIGYLENGRIWGECSGPARESFVLKVYSGDVLLGTSTLNNIGGIIDGDVTVTWSLTLKPSTGGGYWTCEWVEGKPSYALQPNKVELWVDGAKYGQGKVVMNNPDDLNKTTWETVLDNYFAAKIGTTGYLSFAEAYEAANDGDTITVLKEVTLTEETTWTKKIALNGATFATADMLTLADGASLEGANITGTVYTEANATVSVNIPNATLIANGDITFKGDNTVLMFSAGYDRAKTITIGADATLALVSADRMTIGYGHTFDITGNITDAKTVTIEGMKPSFSASGASITGGIGVNFNAKNAYVKFGSSQSVSTKNNTANGTFNMTFENSYFECGKDLYFAVPTNGKNPTVNFTLKDSVLTTGTNLKFMAPGCNTVIEDSEVIVKSSIMNDGILNITEGSNVVVKGYTSSSHGGNFGELVVDGSTLTVDPTKSIDMFIGKGTGKINVKNGGMVDIDYITDTAITVDGTSCLKAEKILGTSTITIDTSKYDTGKVLDLNEGASREGNVTFTQPVPAHVEVTYGTDGDVDFYAPAFVVDGKPFDTIEEAFKAVVDGSVIDIHKDITIDYKWNCNLGRGFSVGTINKHPVTINGNGHKITFTDSLSDPNTNAALQINADATINNLTFDTSNISNTNYRIITSGANNLTVDNCHFIGNGQKNARGIIFGECGGADVSKVEISVTNCTFKDLTKGIIDNERREDVKAVTVSGNIFNSSNVNISASEKITFNNNTLENGWVHILSYSPVNNLEVVAEDNTLEENGTEDTQKNYINAAKVTADGSFVKTVAMVDGKAYLDLGSAIADAAAKATAEAPVTVQLTEGEHEVGTVKLPAVANNIIIKGAVAEDSVSLMAVANTKETVLKNSAIISYDGGAGYNYQNITFDNIGFDGSYITITKRNGAVNKNWTINNCEFLNVPENGGRGAVAFSASTPEEGAVENFTFTNNVINGTEGDATSGLVLRGSKGDVVISDNTITNVNWNAVQVINVAEGSSLVIADNELSSNAEEGVLNLHNVHGVTLEGNTINNEENQNEIGYFEKVAKIGSTYYSSLAAAINGAVEGDVITILAGKYDAFTVPEGKNNLTFVGETDAEGNNLVTIRTNEADIATTVTATTGIYVQAEKATFKNLNLASGTFIPLGTSGREVWMASAIGMVNGAVGAGTSKLNDLTIENCNFKGNGAKYAVWVRACDMIMKDCTIDGYAYGVETYATGADQEINIINTEMTNVGNAIHTVSTTAGSKVNVKDSVIDAEQLHVSGASTITIEGSEIKDVEVVTYGSVALAITDSALYSSEFGTYPGSSSSISVEKSYVENVNDVVLATMLYNIDFNSYYGTMEDYIAKTNLKEVPAVTDTIAVKFVEKSNEEGEVIYDINLAVSDENVINRLNSVDLSFVLNQIDGKNEFEIIKSNSAIAVNPVEHSKTRYEFHFNGKPDGVADTANVITLAQVKFTGYGTFNFAVAKVDAEGNDITTNVAHATKVADNIVDTFVPGGNVANGEGNLDITNSTTGNVTIAVPVRDLTVVVDFPNEVVNKEIAYQAMKVTVTGGDLKSAIEIDLGSNAAPTDLDIFGKVDAKYAVTFADGAYTVALTDTLTVNNSYTVTVTGEGYRTARYTVTMTDDKEINFWNNVKDNETAIEEDVEGSKTTKNFLAGDIVKDNNINIYDLSAVVSYFAKVNNGADYAEYVKYDLNRDGVIDSKDVAYVLVSWNE